MKRKLVGIVSGAILLASTSSLRADDLGGAIIMDVVVARPACLAATVVGGVFYVVSLPFAWTSKRVSYAAQNLVVVPAKATFTRPLGDFHSLQNL